MIKLDKISKIYRVGTFGGKELHAVSEVSFDIGDGEVVSLIGESGSGKSTIGKMILKLISISQGTISFDGTDIALIIGQQNLKQYYRKVQGVFQDPFSSYNPIFKADRVFRVIHDEFFPNMGGAEWDDRVDKALHAVGLNPEHVLNKYPHQLSGGQLQRFLIARALLLDIKILVADEIISMLDASTRIDVLNLLSELKSTGLSILFITHDLSLGYYISEKTVILYRGCTVEMGATTKIFDNPLHPYTKMLMASVPRLDEKWKPSAGEVETRAAAGGPVKGCVYYDRCTAPGRNGGCVAGRPELVKADEEHFVACCCIKN